MGNYCPKDSSHKNWYGAIFCGHCGSRMREYIVRCKVCGHEAVGGNDLIQGWGTMYCTMCGSKDFETIDREAVGRSDLLSTELRRKLKIKEH